MLEPAMDDARANGDLRLDGVRISLGTKTLVAIDAVIAPGEILTVMGPSGSGKSTLLAFVAGFLDPVFSAQGKAFLCGHDLGPLAAEHRRTGVLFQDPLLFPHMSAGQNVMFALPSGGSRAERRNAAMSALADQEMSAWFDADPATLSGGQKARVALARTLASQPLALLLDEPFSKLDANLRQQTRELVFGQAKARGLPVLLVTHDPQDAAHAGGKVVELGETADGR